MQPTSDSLGRPLAKSETATRIGTSERTVDRLIQTKALRAHKVGARWKVFEADIDHYLRGVANRPEEQLTAAGVQA